MLPKVPSTRCDTCCDTCFQLCNQIAQGCHPHRPWVVTNTQRVCLTNYIVYVFNTRARVAKYVAHVVKRTDRHTVHATTGHLPFKSNRVIPLCVSSSLDWCLVWSSSLSIPFFFVQASPPFWAKPSHLVLVQPDVHQQNHRMAELCVWGGIMFSWGQYACSGVYMGTAAGLCHGSKRGCPGSSCESVECCML
jgi:hypothetical protein